MDTYQRGWRELGCLRCGGSAICKENLTKKSPKEKIIKVIGESRQGLNNIQKYEFLSLIICEILNLTSKNIEGKKYPQEKKNTYETTTSYKHGTKLRVGLCVLFFF